MARMPGAHWLGEHSPQRRMARYDVVCVHTVVGFAPAHAAHFSTHADGRIDQSRDTAFQSAANLEGNPRVIAVENEDHGPAYGNWSGSNVPPLTDQQLTAIAKILAWAHAEHGVPLQLCPDSRPGSRGLAYHRQGIDGNFNNGRVSGGETWTLSRGKVCPGDKRIAQLPEILARAKAIAAGNDPTIAKDWFDMADKTDLAKVVADETPNIVKAILAAKIKNNDPDGSSRTVTLGGTITNLEADQDRMFKRLGDVEKKIDDLLAALVASGK